MQGHHNKLAAIFLLAMLSSGCEPGKETAEKAPDGMYVNILKNAPSAQDPITEDPSIIPLEPVSEVQVIPFPFPVYPPLGGGGRGARGRKIPKDLALVKTGELNGAFIEGNTIDYTITITNKGSSTLTNIVVTDPLLGSLLDCGDGLGDQTIQQLGSMASANCTATYTLTAEDIIAGSVSNTASAKDARGNEASDTFVISEPPFAIAVEKTGVLDGDFVLGAEVTYTVIVTNTGDSVLTDIDVYDNTASLECNDGQGSGSFIEILNVGASVQCVGTYALSLFDILELSVTNTVEVTSAEGAFASDSFTIEGQTVYSMRLEKTGFNNSFAAGQPISYTVTVFNTGNAALTNIVVTDDKVPDVDINCQAGDDNIIESLPLGAFAPCAMIYVITEADVLAGSVTNIAQALSFENASAQDSLTIPSATLEIEEEKVLETTLVGE